MLGTDRTLIHPGTPADEVARQAAESAQRRNYTNQLIRQGNPPAYAAECAEAKYPTKA